MTQIKNLRSWLAGTLRLRLVADGLPHVLEHAERGEPTNTSTGLACRERNGDDTHRDPAVLVSMGAGGEIADPS